ncbi:hypothetical protein C6A85_98120 [Mycobacterium sp. ITM-2017-0098]|nr:hypothetical protein C6A85_98120 [Mycobacterium sp. ITM-2017-0098]
MVRYVHIVTTVAAVALVLAGCGSEKTDTSDSSAASASSTSSSASEATTSAAAAAEDDQQIKDLVQAQADAFNAGDWEALGQLTCAKYREQASNPASFLIPPITTFGTAEQAATLDAAQLSGLLAEKFGSGASPATLDRTAQAIVVYDEVAYQEAMLDLLTESAELNIDKVDNIKVAGDTATADVTATRVMGDGPPQAATETTPFVREDGRWLDCTDMAAAGR